MDGPYTVERAIGPVDGKVTWLVLDDRLDPVPEVARFALYLDGGGASVNTLRAYIPRLARFLNWCHRQGVDWTKISLPQLILYKRGLEAEPGPTGKARVGKTVNAHITAIVEFLRYCARVGRIDDAVVDKFVEAKHLRFVPETMPQRERGAHRFVAAKVVKAKEFTRPPESLTDDEVSALLSATTNVRDLFLIQLMVETGLRIGETLGLRREDLHLLPDSRALGCTIGGAHVHVRRRINDNGALAKSHYPRSVPVGADTVAVYRDYQYERDRLVPDGGCGFVFVNLYWSTAPDTAMKYPNTRSCLTRVARRAGVQARLHMLRHTAGTAWARSGTPIDVVQKLMGHQSPVSTAKYLHPSDEQMRHAVDTVASLRSGRPATTR
ncbi:MAG: tyrosine-type recombinase/integrase [Rhodococcus sp. (in: high G+C Gram-positive bacteria)]|uniref:tyrosine-type recombinase/integrase n=1 Tax=Rhodococcus sp. TaxID=1831 RepID=UPI003BB1C6F8